MPVQSNRSEAIVHLDSTVTLKRWEQMSDAQLDTIVRASISEIQVLSRLAQAEARQRLLPALQEIKRRFKAGEKVCGCKGIEEYFNSIGVNPNTVHQWEFRIRQREIKALPELAGQEDEDSETAAYDHILRKLREPNIESDGFALDAFTCATGHAKNGRMRVYIFATRRHPGFYFITREDPDVLKRDGSSVIETTLKPVRKDGVLLFLESMHIQPNLLEWDVGDGGSVDENPYLMGMVEEAGASSQGRTPILE